MDYRLHLCPSEEPHGCSRRTFLGGTLGAAAGAALWEAAAAVDDGPARDVRAQSQRDGEFVVSQRRGAEHRTFYDCITPGKFDNPTVPRAVDGALTCILGREAGRRHRRLTMDERLKENKRIEADLTGLKD